MEVYHDGEWGTICDDFFWRKDAKVACKQMGYTGAEAVLTDVAVAPDRRFWLDDVNCTGSEMKLTECFYNNGRVDPQWGFANCIPSEQVGVRCTASTTANSVEFNKENLTVQEQGGGSRYTVRLGKAPSGTVTVAISGQSGTVLIDDTPLTFTTGNWSTPQTVTLTAVDDSNRTDDSFTLTHTASGGGYGSVTASLSVTVEDDDGPVQAHIDSGGILTLTEGGSRTYRIWLDSAPTEQVTVAVTAPSKVSVNPTSMTFTTGNWSTPQTVTLEAQHDNDTSDETQYVTHRATKGDYTTTLSRVQVEITDDDDGEDRIGSRPSGAVWWAALTARSETGGATGHIDYTSPHADTGKLSNDSFTYGGVTRAIDGLFVGSNGHFQIWVDSGNGSALPNGSILHVGSESMTLESATRQSFRTMYNDGRTPTMREHAYWWQSGSHSVSLSDRQVKAVWLEVPAGSELPSEPRSVEAQPRDGKTNLEWVAPPEVPSKPVTSYEYQQEGTETWNSTGGTATTKEVAGLANGEVYTFRVRAVNAAGKGAASAPSQPVTPAANTAPTGLPTITGTAQVGETLTASASGVADADGLTNAVFAWRWIANDGSADAEIADATGSTYTLTTTEAGKTIKARATFTDDGGAEETLLSGATATVVAASGLTAAFENAPASHDGSSAFKLRIAFSEGISISFRTFRDASLSVSGGSVTKAKRVDRRKDLWDGDGEAGSSIGDVTVTLEGGRACGTFRERCAPADGRALSNDDLDEGSGSAGALGGGRGGSRRRKRDPRLHGNALPRGVGGGDGGLRDLKRDGDGGGGLHAGERDADVRGGRDGEDRIGGGARRCARRGERDADAHALERHGRAYLGRFGDGNDQQHRPDAACVAGAVRARGGEPRGRCGRGAAQGRIPGRDAGRTEPRLRRRSPSYRRRGLRAEYGQERFRAESSDAVARLRRGRGAELPGEG